MGTKGWIAVGVLGILLLAPTFSVEDDGGAVYMTFQLLGWLCIIAGIVGYIVVKRAD